MKVVGDGLRFGEQSEPRSSLDDSLPFGSHFSNSPAGTTGDVGGVVGPVGSPPFVTGRSENPIVFEYPREAGSARSQLDGDKILTPPAVVGIALADFVALPVYSFPRPAGDLRKPIGAGQREAGEEASHQESVLRDFPALPVVRMFFRFSLFAGLDRGPGFRDTAFAHGIVSR